MLEVKGEPTEANLKNIAADEMALLASWKAGKKVKGKKAALLKFYQDTAAPNKPLAWTDAEEEQLTRLKTAAITFNDTEMDTALKQSANAVKTNISQLNDDQAAELLEALTKRSAAAASTTTTTTSNNVVRHPDGEHSAPLKIN